MKFINNWHKERTIHKPAEGNEAIIGGLSILPHKNNGTATHVWDCSLLTAFNMKRSIVIIGIICSMVKMEAPHVLELCLNMHK